MVEATTKTPTRSHDGEKAQDKKRSHELAPSSLNTLASETPLLNTVLGSSVMEPQSERHTALLHDLRFSPTVNFEQRAGVVSALQRTYGNAYTQKVVDCTHEPQTIMPTTAHDVLFRQSVYGGHELAHAGHQGVARVARRPDEARTKTAAHPPKGVEEEPFDVDQFVQELRAKGARVDICELLRNASQLQLLGREKEAQAALRTAAEKASVLLREKTAKFDIEFATGEMVADLLKAAEDVIMLGGNRKAAESAIEKATAWAKNWLATATERLDIESDEEFFKDLARAMQQVMLFTSDEKLVETARQKMLDWVKPRLASALSSLKRRPTQNNLDMTRKYTNLIYRLGGISKGQYQNAQRNLEFYKEWVAPKIIVERDIEGTGGAKTGSVE